MPGGIAMDVRGQHRAACLLELEEQNVSRAAALQQGNVRTEPDTSHAHNLVRDVDQCVTTNRPSPVRSQCQQVFVETLGDRCCIRVTNPSDQWRVLHNPPLSLMFGGEPRQGAVTRPRAGSLRGALDLVTERLLGRRLVQPPDIEPVVLRISSGCSARKRTSSRYAPTQ